MSFDRVLLVAFRSISPNTEAAVASVFWRNGSSAGRLAMKHRLSGQADAAGAVIHFQPSDMAAGLHVGDDALIGHFPGLGHGDAAPIPVLTAIPLP